MNVEPPETFVIIESIVYKSNGFAIVTYRLMKLLTGLEIRHEKPLAISMEKILKWVLLTTLREDGINL